MKSRHTGFPPGGAVPAHEGGVKSSRPPRGDRSSRLPFPGRCQDVFPFAEALILLSDLAGALALPTHGPDVEVTGIAVDSRQVRPGDLFVAQRGARTDGLAFVPEARARGAVAVCAAAPVPGFST
ncbi:MAG: hypothetical protein H0V43_00865, partial [Gemmatimonadales bacterium]|nr:hypothetical protein [Gemmatimonadales bacterium]